MADTFMKFSGNDSPSDVPFIASSFNPPQWLLAMIAAGYAAGGKTGTIMLAVTHIELGTNYNPVSRRVEPELGLHLRLIGQHHGLQTIQTSSGGDKSSPAPEADPATAQVTEGQHCQEPAAPEPERPEISTSDSDS